MLATIKSGQNILIDIKNSCRLEPFFKLVSSIKENDLAYFSALKDLILKVEQRKKGFVVKSIFASLKEMAKTTKKKIKAKKEKASKKKRNENQLMVKPELKVLWLSRHNMLTEAYLDLITNLYPDYYVNIFPCQPRILEGRQVFEAAAKFNCTVICAILSDELFQDVISNHVEANKYTILRPIMTVEETEYNYSPLHTLKVNKQKSYIFQHWLDVKSNKIFKRDT